MLSVSGSLHINTHIHKLCFLTFTTGGAAFSSARQFPVVLSLTSRWLYGWYLVVRVMRGVPPSSSGRVEVFLVGVAVMVVSTLSVHTAP